MCTLLIDATSRNQTQAAGQAPSLEPSNQGSPKVRGGKPLAPDGAGGEAPGTASQHRGEREMHICKESSSQMSRESEQRTTMIGTEMIPIMAETNGR